VWPAVIVILTTTVLAGSVSLCFSVSCKHAISRFFGRSDILACVLDRRHVVHADSAVDSKGFIPSSCSIVGWLLTLINPYIAFVSTIRSLFPGPGPALPWSWAAHCVVSAAMSAGFAMDGPAGAQGDDPAGLRSESAGFLEKR